MIQIITNLILLILIGMVVIAIIAFILAAFNRIFTRIPTNHIVCGEIPSHEGDGRFVSFYTDKQGKDAILAAHDENLRLRGKNPADAEHRQSRNRLSAQIKTRDGNLLFGWLVWIFNLHFMTWNPFVTLRKITIEKSHIQEQGDVSKMVTKEAEKKTAFLRIKWPRPMFLEDVELKNNLKIDLVVKTTEITVSDPWLIFYKNPQVNRWADLQTSSGVNNYLGKNTIEQFQETDFGSENLEFNEAVKSQRYYEVGLCPTGTFSIPSWDIDSSQKIILEEKQKQAAAEAVAKTKEIVAGGDAKAILLVGGARADVAKRMTQAIGDNQGAALVQAAQAVGEAKGTVILGGAGSNVLLTQPMGQPQGPGNGQGNNQQGKKNKGGKQHGKQKGNKEESEIPADDTNPPPQADDEEDEDET